MIIVIKFNKVTSYKNHILVNLDQVRHDKLSHKIYLKIVWQHLKATHSRFY